MNSQQIIALCKHYPAKKILWRSGIDYRYADSEGISIKGYKRNREVTLDELIKNVKAYCVTEVEKSECTEDTLVFHSYSCSDME